MTDLTAPPTPMTDACPTDGCDCRTNPTTELTILRTMRDLVVHHTEMVEGGLGVTEADVRMMRICVAHGWFQPNLGKALITLMGTYGDAWEAWE